MESVLTFIKVTLAFAINITHDAIHGVINFIVAHWAEIKSFAMYVWFNIQIFAHWISNMITSHLA